MTLDTVVGAFNDGATAEEITSQYPSLSLADSYAVIAYYLRHRKEIDDYIATRASHATAVKAETEPPVRSCGRPQSAPRSQVGLMT